jgi:hypothetical protein
MSLYMFTGASLSTISAWRITATRNLSLNTGAATLDEVTCQLPEGYYSTFRTFGGGTRVIGLSAHLRRLYEPVSIPEADESFLRQQLRALLEGYRPGTRPCSDDLEGRPTCHRASPALREIYEKSVRGNDRTPATTSRLKSTSFISRRCGKKAYCTEGMFETLLVKREHPGMTSNFFLINALIGMVAPLRTNVDSARRLRSPQRTLLAPLSASHFVYRRDGILLGITRQTVVCCACDGTESEVSALKRNA